ncbi:MAG: ABC transporter permease DevC, partial [Spirulinaceae cyanobacterium]
MKTPLAWLQLSHERIRLVIALAGIAFADILMFMQFGFRDALYESAVTLHRKIEGDIFLLSPDSTALIAMDQFSQRRLYQVRGIDGVAEVHPIYLDFAIWKNPITAEPRGIMVIGINPESDILNLNGLKENKNQIKLEDTVLFDSASRPEFGPIPELFQEQGRFTTEAGGRKLTVGGLFELGASFGADGNLISSDINFLRLFENRDRGLIDVGVIELENTANLEVVLAQIRQQLPADVLVFSKEEFIAFEMAYWQESTAIGFIFTLGAGMGFIVGMVIVYQILYTDVANH